MPVHQSPCKDCADRFLGCHSTCESYAEFQKEISAFNVNMRKEKAKYKQPYMYRNRRGGI